MIALISFGARSSMGFFQLPMIETRGWDRTTFGLAMAIQNLIWGLGQPIFGAISDKYGTWRVLLFSGICYAAGLFLMASAQEPVLLHMAGGILVGLGVASSSFAIIMATFARNVAPEQRGLAFGLGTAAASLGMAVFSPLTIALIDQYGWQEALIWLSALVLVIPLLGIPLAGNSSQSALSDAELPQTMREALRQALGHSSYILLLSGFFVCGFHVAFINTHYPAYLSDIGMDPGLAATAMLLIGFFNIFGSLGSGIITQTYSKPMFLTWLYILRAIVITLFLILPQTPASVVTFSIALGLLWLSTVPPTNALVAVMFGTRYLGLLGGIVFLTHQIGSFIGVWLGGYLYDQFGSFDVIWWLAVVLGLAAAIIHWPIKEERVGQAA